MFIYLFSSEVVKLAGWELDSLNKEIFVLTGDM